VVRLGPGEEADLRAALRKARDEVERLTREQDNRIQDVKVRAGSVPCRPRPPLPPQPHTPHCTRPPVMVSRCVLLALCARSPTACGMLRCGYIPSVFAWLCVREPAHPLPHVWHFLPAQRTTGEIWNAERAELMAANTRLHEERMELRSALEEERARVAEATAGKDSLRPELTRLRDELCRAEGAGPCLRQLLPRVTRALNGELPGGGGERQLTKKHPPAPPGAPSPNNNK
jgi:hypothetical protein